MALLGGDFAAASFVSSARHRVGGGAAAESSAGLTVLGTNSVPTAGTVTCTNSGTGSAINGDVGSRFTSITNSGCTITGTINAPVPGSVVTDFNTAYSALDTLNPACDGVRPRAPRSRLHCSTATITRSRRRFYAQRQCNRCLGFQDRDRRSGRPHRHRFSGGHGRYRAGVQRVLADRRGGHDDGFELPRNHSLGCRLHNDRRKLHRARIGDGVAWQCSADDRGCRRAGIDHREQEFSSRTATVPVGVDLPIRRVRWHRAAERG